MKLGRLNHIALIVLLLTAGCSDASTPIPDIMVSKMDNADLLGRFDARLGVLSSDSARFMAEMKLAGFVLKPSSSPGCGTWEYPKGKNGLNAFVQYCEASGAIDIGRIGILRGGAMTYD